MTLSPVESLVPSQAASARPGAHFVRLFHNNGGTAEKRGRGSGRLARITPVRHEHDDHCVHVYFADNVNELVDLLLNFLSASTTLTLTTKEGIMSNYQLNAGDSVVVTITDTDDVTNLPVTPDAGSVAATLSNISDSLVVDSSGTFVTLTAGTTPAVGATLTVDATVGGVPSATAVGTYDVVAAVVPDATSLSLSFDSETTATVASSTETLPVQVTVSNGSVLPAGSPLPEGTMFTETAELLNLDGSVYTGS